MRLMHCIPKYPITFCGWTLDRYKMQAFDKSGKSAKLTIKEYQLLETLACHLDQVLDRKQLLSISKGRNYDVTERAIDTLVTRIRKKIDRGNGQEILRCVRGKGYYLVSKI